MDSLRLFDSQHPADLTGLTSELNRYLLKKGVVHPVPVVTMLYMGYSALAQEA